MSSANDRQVGGNHYKGREYQHWDFVTDVKLPYLLGCATKYISRWRDKNGVQDLEKALHYIDKAEERGLSYGKKMDNKRRKKLKKFAEQHDDHEAFAITCAVIGDYSMARQFVREIISVNAPETPTQESQG